MKRIFMIMLSLCTLMACESTDDGTTDPSLYTAEVELTVNGDVPSAGTTCVVHYKADEQGEGTVTFTMPEGVVSGGSVTLRLIPDVYTDLHIYTKTDAVSVTIDGTNVYAALVQDASGLCSAHPGDFFYGCAFEECMYTFSEGANASKSVTMGKCTDNITFKYGYSFITSLESTGLTDVAVKINCKNGSVVDYGSVKPNLITYSPTLTSIDMQIFGIKASADGGAQNLSFYCNGDTSVAGVWSLTSDLADGYVKGTDFEFGTIYTATCNSDTTPSVEGVIVGRDEVEGPSDEIN